MKLYRVENRESNAGLWYSLNQESSHMAADLNLSGKNLPMEFNPEIANSKWRSAAETLAQLGFWFTHEDLQKLIPLGYKLYEIHTDVWKMHETEWYKHPLFLDTHVSDSIVLDIDLLLPKSMKV